MAFRSAPPHGGRPGASTPRSRISSFDPRPRTGGDLMGFVRRFWHVLVSIRAPARGATPCRRYAGRGPDVSIRAPARGATCRSGADHRSGLFRSAPPHGGRRCLASRSRISGMFRSAPPHGGRRTSGTVNIYVNGFDPRPRTGGDVDRLCRGDGAGVSIRAPARGATPYFPYFPYSPWCFDPRPRTGGDDTVNV